MRGFSAAFVLTAAIVVSHAPSAYAQRWGRERLPRSGVCFYEDKDFGGRYFCSAPGEAIQIPRDMNDKISSIRIVGDAVVTVFRDDSFRGQSRVIDSDVRNLRDVGFNDRISSYRVDVSRRFGNDRDRDDRDRDDRYRDDRYRDERRNGRLSSREAEDIVRRGYRAVLQRDPDANGLRDWTQQVLKNNWTQSDLEAALRQSDEYRALRENRRRER